MSALAIGLRGYTPQKNGATGLWRCGGLLVEICHDVHELRHVLAKALPCLYFGLRGLRGLGASRVAEYSVAPWDLHGSARSGRKTR